MKTFLCSISLIVSLFYFNQSNAQIDTEWVRVFVGPVWDEWHGLTTDPSGNIYTVGWAYYGNYNYDFAFGKYNSSGSMKWFKSYSNVPGIGIDISELIEYDPNGYVYIAGESSGLFTLFKYTASGDSVWSAMAYNAGSASVRAMTLDAQGNIILAGAGDENYVVIKYDPSGTQLWKSIYNYPGWNNFHRINDVVTDAEGNIYITGESSDISGKFDIATIKYNSRGDTIWTRRYAGPTDEDERGLKIIPDNHGSLFVGGYATDTTSINSAGYITLKYDTSGILKWVKRYDGVGENFDCIRDMVVDASGNLYVTGESAINNSGKCDIATIKYSTNGEAVWTKRFTGTSSLNEPKSMTIDKDANIYITGYTYVIGGGSWNGLTIKYDSTGAEKWNTIYNGASNSEDELYAIALDSNNDVIVAGRTYGDTTSFDFLTIKYANGVSGIPIIASGDPDYYISCYPNPILSYAFINYYVPADRQIAIKIVNMLGTVVETIKDGNDTEGNHTLQINTETLSAGTYLIRMESRNLIVTNKFCVMK